MDSRQNTIERLLRRIRLRRRFRAMVQHSSDAMVLAISSLVILLLSERLFSIAIPEPFETLIPIGVMVLAMTIAFFSVRPAPISEAVEAELKESIPQTISTSLLARQEGFDDEAAEMIAADADKIAAHVDPSQAVPLGRPDHPWRAAVALVMLIGAFSMPGVDLLGIEQEQVRNKRESDRTARKIASLDRRLREVSRLAEVHKIDEETTKLLKQLSRKEQKKPSKKRAEGREATRQDALKRTKAARSQVKRRLGRSELSAARSTADRVRRAGEQQASPESRAGQELQKALRKGELGRAGQQLQKLAKAAQKPGAEGDQARADLAKLAQALGLSGDLASKLNTSAGGSKGNPSAQDLKALADQMELLARLLRESDLLDHASKQIKFTEAELSSLPSEWPEGPPPEICPDCLAGT
jgi:hypothetical protein